MSPNSASITAQPIDENPNLAWAALFVDELARGGVETVCIAPGSRSTPLTLAFHANNNFEVYQHLDERSAAFFALGISMSIEKPVAVVCTSGTAAANLHPAIIEAQMSQVPLLILTADRPPELRHSGANQTIDQVKMFGDHVLWSVDVALPQADAPIEALRNLQTLAARALAYSGGFRKGPVHLNFPFRKPLEPANSANWLAASGVVPNQRPFTQIEQGIIQPTVQQVKLLVELIEKHPHGLIVCGPQCPTGEFPSAIAQLAKTTGYPILADPLSGARFGPFVSTAPVIGGYETFLQTDLTAWPEPDLILRFGSVPTSKWLNSFLDEMDLVYHIHIREGGRWADQNHTTTHFYQVDPTALCHQLTRSIRRPADNIWLRHWTSIETRSWTVVKNQFSKSSFDGAFVAALLDQLPAGSTLFSGNSLAIRHVDQFGQPHEKPLRIFANRGASGIDGNISTGLGIAATTSERTVLLVGDITLYHDSNGLLALKQFGLDKVIIILLNNNGGGIFRRLPVAKIEPPFEDLFLTPHNLDFGPLAAMYELNHHVVTDYSDFRPVFDTAMSTRSASIIEIQTDGQKDDQLRRQIISQVKSQITPL